MPDSPEVRLARLEEQVRGVREDIDEMRTAAKEDHHRLRSVEGAVKQMVDAQRDARAGEARQYRRLASSVQVGSLMIALGMLVLAVVTILTHH